MKKENKPKRIQNSLLPEAYIFDIDGTLAHMNGRSPYDYSLVHTDIVDEDVRLMCFDLIYNGYSIIIVSGRKSECKQSTSKWLDDNGIYYTSLYMREDGDNRNDAIVKREIAEKYVLPFYNVRGVFDDRDRVVAMWREIGLTTYQVAYGDF